jgi:hypothetical protein
MCSREAACVELRAALLRGLGGSAAGEIAPLLEEWERLRRSPELAANLGAGHAAQALGVHCAALGLHAEARSWLEQAERHCLEEALFPKRHLYFTLMGAGLREHVQEQLSRLREGD